MKRRIRNKKAKQHVMNRAYLYDCVILNKIGVNEMLHKFKHDRCLRRYERKYLGEDLR